MNITLPATLTIADCSFEVDCTATITHGKRLKSVEVNGEPLALTEGQLAELEEEIQPLFGE